MFFRLCETFFAIVLNVSKNSPFIVFIFCKRIDVQRVPKGPPFNFRLYATYQGFQNNSKKNSENFFPQSGTVEEGTVEITLHFEYLTPFAIFEPWIWRQLGSFPTCCFFLFILVSHSHLVLILCTVLLTRYLVSN